MKTRSLLYMLFLILSIVGCEDLEDTYSDYAGDGAILYVGKCTNVSVTPGWKRLIVKWSNNPDVRVHQIKVTWETSGVRDSLLLAPDVTECSIPDLEDGNYEVRVYGVDKNGKESLTIPLFERPYTPTHETIASFTRLIAKHYFVKDRLAIFFSTWSSAVVNAELSYYSGGELKTLVLDSATVAQKYLLMPDPIDMQNGQPTKVTLSRKGRIEGCKDLILFDPYELNNEKLYTTDFRQLMKMKYGESGADAAFLASLEELEIDYTINSFEDILNLPNLKKLALGKNRFQKADYLDESISGNASDSKVYEEEGSLFALQVANEVCGLVVERYNQHFLPGKTLPYMKEMGNPTLPDIACLDASDWKITCIPDDEGSYDSNLESLFDGNLSNYWQPESQQVARTHEITVDMKQVQAVKGVKIVQKDFNPKDDKMSGNLLLRMIKIKISPDNLAWQDATYVEENMLGATAGETTILYFPSSREVRYVKFIVDDQSYGKNFSVTLADIGVF